MIDNLKRATDAGYRPGVVASIWDGIEIRIISYPYTDGREIWVLGRSKPDDPASWKEFRLDELDLLDGQRTPAVSDE